MRDNKDIMIMFVIMGILVIMCKCQRKLEFLRRRGQGRAKKGEERRINNKKKNNGKSDKEKAWDQIKSDNKKLESDIYGQFKKDYKKMTGWW